MNKKIVLLASASLFLLSAVIGSQLIVSVAAQRAVGVSEGDWALYDVTISGNGTAPFPVEPIDWAKITVEEISGTTITFETIVRYPNATEETETMVVDVDTGLGNGSGFFIAANLNAGELIYTSPDPDDPFYGMTINETIFRTYPVGTVEVNHWNLMMTVPGVGTSSMNYYWFKATGMMAELSMYYLLQPLEGDTTWWEMKVSVIDIIPEFPPALILPLFMIATLIAVWLGKTIWSTKKSIKKPSLCA